MKLVADESIEKRIVENLRIQGFDVLYIAELAPAIPDKSVLHLSIKQKRILLTNDKDFGELVFLEKEITEGIILLRFSTEKTDLKSRILLSFLQTHKEKIRKHFIVLTENLARIRRIF
ncbi:MAG: DUF5615 family PIN-like protein [Elusimicrobia bacterium]|nr:DUF5615 family PIN-like protein [Elusimicrobiota bacterium]